LISIKQSLEWMGGLENKKGMRERKHCVRLQIAWQDWAERLEAT